MMINANSPHRFGFDVSSRRVSVQRMRLLVMMFHPFHDRPCRRTRVDVERTIMKTSLTRFVFILLRKQTGKNFANRTVQYVAGNTGIQVR